MRPYLAIIKDSFREALASRVLWILLALTTLFLVFLAPLGIDEVQSTALTERDLLSPASMVATLRKGADAAQNSPAKHIWSLLPEKLRNDLSAPPPEGASDLLSPELVASFRQELNRALESPEFYDADAFANARLNKETRDLVDQNSLSAAKLLKRNRLLLETVFPSQVAAMTPPTLSFAYLGMSLGGDLPVSKDMMLKSVLTVFMDFFVGTIGVFIAILVTASIVPHTFEAGAIDLLLSKPISRFWLYVTKFLGGCAFTLINAVYVVGGIWLLAGVRYDFWNQKLLLCIPLFMFLFAIYYSVSALAGVIWRNAIVSVVMTILFWVACFTVGTSKGVLEDVFLSARRLTRVVPAEGDLLAVDESSDLTVWNADKSAWDPVPENGATQNRPPRMMGVGAMFPVLGPVYNVPKQELFAIRRPFPRPGQMSGSSFVYIGRKSDRWLQQQGLAAPGGTVAVGVDPRGRLLAMGAGGILAIEGEAKTRNEKVKIFGWELPVPNASARFVNLAPSTVGSSVTSAAIAADTGAVAMLDRRQLQVLTLNDKGRYELRGEAELPSRQAGVTAIGGDTVVVALADGSLRLYDAVDLRLREELSDVSKSPPRFAYASPDGRWFAVVFHDRRLWLYDAETNQDRSADIGGQKDISAAAFDAENRLLVADRFTRVSRYDLNTFSVDQRWQPTLDVWERLHRYFIKPLYTVFPKPGELGNLVSYLLTEQETAPTSGNEDDLSGSRVKIDVWRPVWTNLIFTTVVVALGGWYTQRKDF